MPFYRRFVNLLSQKKGSKLLRSLGVVSIFTLFSRILGFVRDVVLANFFGAGIVFDAWVVAFKIPNLFRRLFAEGAFAQAFVPILAKSHANDTPEATRELIQRSTGTLATILLVFVILGEILAPWLIMVFSPGFFVTQDSRAELATHMLHITFPYIFFISLVALAGSVLNVWQRFVVSAFTPIWLNLSLIAGACVGYFYFKVPIYGLAWGVMAAGVIQLLFQLPSLYKIGVLSWPRLGFHHPGVRRVMKLMVPALFGVSVAQLSLFIDNFFASFLPNGSISWLYYSDRLIFLPTGVIGVALSTVILPHLSRHHSEDQKQFSHTINWALKLVLMVGMPCAVGLLTFAGPIVATIFQHGAFSDHDVLMTMKSLMAFSLGLPAFMLVKILAASFYSQQNIKTPVKIAAVALLINIVLNLVLIKPLHHTGLALSTSIAGWFNMIFLLVFLLKNRSFSFEAGWRVFSLRLLVANGLMATVVLLTQANMNTWLTWSLSSRVVHGGLILLYAVVVYVVSLYLMGFRLRQLSHREVV